MWNAEEKIGYLFALDIFKLSSNPYIKLRLSCQLYSGFMFGFKDNINRCILIFFQLPNNQTPSKK